MGGTGLDLDHWWMSLETFSLSASRIGGGFRVTSMLLAKSQLAILELGWELSRHAFGDAGGGGLLVLLSGTSRRVTQRSGLQD